jgi:hypothetical protein
LRWLDKFLNGRMLDEINREMPDNILAADKAEKVKNSSVNRVTEVVRAVLRKAYRCMCCKSQEAGSVLRW